MPTKYPAVCPKCGTEVMPCDRAVPVDTEYGDVPFRQWRYECTCGWTWANAAQRAHNDHEYSKLRRRLDARGWQ